MNTTLCKRSKVTYRRNPTLKNKIAPSKLKCIKKDDPLCLIPLKGMYRCNKSLCKTCQFVNHGQKSFTHKDKLYLLDSFYNCSSDYVVYCLMCPCKMLYVGRTIRPLRRRFGKHRRLSHPNSTKHSVPRRFLEHHARSTVGLWVWVIESIPRGLSEAERFLRLCQCETFWILTLDTLAPNGLNEELEVNTIL